MKTPQKRKKTAERSARMSLPLVGGRLYSALSFRLRLNVFIRPVKVLTVGREGCVFGVGFESVLPPFIKLVDKQFEGSAIDDGVDRRIEAEVIRARDRAEKIIILHYVFRRVAVICVDEIG